MDHFKKTLRTIGATDVNHRASGEKWSFWTARFDTPAGATHGHYLYLNSQCPYRVANALNKKQWSTLSTHSGISNQYEIIVTPSDYLNRDLIRIKDLFGGKSVKSTQILIRDELMKEVKFADVDPTHSFVEPDLMHLPQKTT